MRSKTPDEDPALIFDTAWKWKTVDAKTPGNFTVESGEIAGMRFGQNSVRVHLQE